MGSPSRELSVQTVRSTLEGLVCHRARFLRWIPRSGNWRGYLHFTCISHTDPKGHQLDCLRRLYPLISRAPGPNMKGAKNYPLPLSCPKLTVGRKQHKPEIVPLYCVESLCKYTPGASCRNRSPADAAELSRRKQKYKMEYNASSFVPCQALYQPSFIVNPTTVHDQEATRNASTLHRKTQARPTCMPLADHSGPVYPSGNCKKKTLVFFPA